MSQPTARRRVLVPLLLLATAATACGGGDGGTGPNDDEVFGTYTLVRAAGQSVPGALVLESDLGFGALVGTYAQSGSFRISEDGTWAFSFHFQQIGVSPDPDLPVITTEYDVDDSGTYTLQGETITLDGGTVVTLTNGVLSRSIFYDVPGAPPTTVVYEFEK
jgi:hypothetical protein